MITEPAPPDGHVIRGSPVATGLQVLMVQALLLLLMVALMLLVWALGQYTGRAVVAVVVPLVVFFAVLADAGVVLLVLANWMRTLYIVRPGEVVVERGLFNVQKDTYEMGSMQSVEVRESFWGRLFGYGTIQVKVMGLEGPVELVNVPEPEFYARAIRRHTGRDQE